MSYIKRKLLLVSLMLCVLPNFDYAAEAKSGITISGAAGYVSYPGYSNSFNINDDSMTLSLTGGISMSPMISYRYAVNDYLELGASTGFIYSVAVGESATSSASANVSVSVNEVASIPLLAQARFVTGLTHRICKN